MYYFGKPPQIKLLQERPYGRFLEITEEIMESCRKYDPPTEEQLEDLRIAFGDQPGSEGGNYAYFGTRALIDIAKENSYYLYVLPGLREGFIKFCLKHEPDYLPLMKESFLLFNVLEYIFEEEIPAFDPFESQEVLREFVEYKEDFQKGIVYYVDKFKGSYMLSEEQKRYLKENLANDEKRLLDFLQPGKLRKYNISKLDLLTEGVSLFVPLPVGILVDLGREIKEVRDFRRANLDFVLSLVILKKMTNVGKIERTINCAVCAISPVEIENMTEDECNDVMYNRELCIEHMVARLDLKKRFRLYGKNRLREMKRLGDSSIWMEP